MAKNKSSFEDNLKKLTDISNWFEKQEEVDVEEGLKKIKEAAVLLKDSKKRLGEIENEFEEIKKDIEVEVKSEPDITETEKTKDEKESSDIPF